MRCGKKTAGCCGSSITGEEGLHRAVYFCAPLTRIDRENSFVYPEHTLYLGTHCFATQTKHGGRRRGNDIKQRTNKRGLHLLRYETNTFGACAVLHLTPNITKPNIIRFVLTCLNSKAQRDDGMILPRESSWCRCNPQASSFRGVPTSYASAHTYMRKKLTGSLQLGRSGG